MSKDTKKGKAALSLFSVDDIAGQPVVTDEVVEQPTEIPVEETFSPEGREQLQEETGLDLGVGEASTKAVDLAGKFAEGATFFPDVVQTHAGTAASYVADPVIEAITGVDMYEDQSYTDRLETVKSEQREYKKERDERLGIAGDVAEVAGNVVGIGKFTKVTSKIAPLIAGAKAAGKATEKALKSVPVANKIAGALGSGVQTGLVYGATDATFFTASDINTMWLDETLTTSRIGDSISGNLTASILANGTLKSLSGVSGKMYQASKKSFIGVGQSERYIRDVAKTLSTKLEGRVQAFQKRYNLSNKEMATLVVKSGADSIEVVDNPSMALEKIGASVAKANRDLSDTIDPYKQMGRALDIKNLKNRMLDLFRKEYGKVGYGKYAEQAKNVVEGLEQVEGKQAAKRLVSMRTRILEENIGSERFRQKAVKLIDESIKSTTKNYKAFMDELVESMPAAKIKKGATAAEIKAAKADVFTKPLKEVETKISKVDNNILKREEQINKIYEQMSKADAEGLADTAVFRKLEERLTNHQLQIESLKSDRLDLVRKHEIFEDGVEYVMGGSKMSRISSNLKNSKDMNGLYNFVEDSLKDAPTPDNTLGAIFKDAIASRQGFATSVFVGAGAAGALQTASGGEIGYDTLFWGVLGTSLISAGQGARAVLRANTARAQGQTLARFNSEAAKTASDWTEIVKPYAKHPLIRDTVRTVSNIALSGDYNDEEIGQALNAGLAKSKFLIEPVPLETAQFIQPEATEQMKALATILDGPKDLGGDEGLFTQYSEALKSTGIDKATKMRTILETMRNDLRYEDMFEQGDTIDGMIVNSENRQDIADKLFTQRLDVPIVVRKRLIDAFVEDGNLDKLKHELNQATRQPRQKINPNAF